MIIIIVIIINDDDDDADDDNNNNKHTSHKYFGTKRTTDNIISYPLFDA